MNSQYLKYLKQLIIIELQVYDELHSWLILAHNVTNIASVIDDRAFGVSTDFVIASYEWTDSEIIRSSNSLIFAVGELGTATPINNTSTRIAFLPILLFAFIIYTHYLSGVVSARLNEPIRKINDSLGELAKLPLKFSSEHMIYFDFFHKKTRVGNRKVLYTKRWLALAKQDRFMLPETAMQLVREGGFAYHTHTDVAYPMVDRSCMNREIFELAVALNNTIVEVVRVGANSLTPEFYDGFERECIWVFAASLILLFIGYLIAVMICIVEIMYTNRRVIQSNSTAVKFAGWLFEDLTLNLCDNF